MACLYWIHLADHTNVTTQGYIGITDGTALQRFRKHKWSATGRRFAHYPIHRAINKYGDALVVDTLVEGSSEYIAELETKLRPAEKIGWNLAIGGSAVRLGSKHSEAARQKLRDTHLGKRLSAETRAKVGAYHKGKQKSSECRQKMSLAAKALQPWQRSTAVEAVWRNAGTLHKCFTDNPGIGAIKLAVVSGIGSVRLDTILSKFKAGWNPQSDSEYQAWLERTNG